MIYFIKVAYQTKAKQNPYPKGTLFPFSLVDTHNGREKSCSSVTCIAYGRWTPFASNNIDEKRKMMEEKWNKQKGTRNGESDVRNLVHLASGTHACPTCFTYAHNCQGRSSRLFWYTWRRNNSMKMCTANLSYWFVCFMMIDALRLNECNYTKRRKDAFFMTKVYLRRIKLHMMYIFITS